MACGPRGAAVAALLWACAGVAPAWGATADPESQGDESRERHPVLFYIPNRIFDALDVARVRVRVGPGFAVNARVTEPVSVNAGAYTSIFAGSPGPRGRPKLNLPVGVESYAGVGVSVLDAETEALGPGYGPLEIGAGVHAALIGLDLGFDPLELVDFVLGILFIDIRGDDF